MKTTEKISEEYLDKIISVAYGDSGVTDKLKLYFDASKNPDIKKLLNEYRGTAREVHLLPREEYDGKQVTNKTNIPDRFLNYVYQFFRRPILAAMAVMLISGVVGYVIISNSNNSTGEYTRAELILAKKQAKESFAIVASIMNKTEDKLKKEVFYEKINKPVNKTMAILNTYL